MEVSVHKVLVHAHFFSGPAEKVVAPAAVAGASPVHTVPPPCTTTHHSWAVAAAVREVDEPVDPVYAPHLMLLEPEPSCQYPAMPAAVDHWIPLLLPAASDTAPVPDARTVPGLPNVT